MNLAKTIYFILFYFILFRVRCADSIRLRPTISAVFCRKKWTTCTQHRRISVSCLCARRQLASVRVAAAVAAAADAVEASN